jgi:hypothetical protein
MMLARCPNASFPVSYFELFVHGLTNICRTLYFSMDVAMNVAEFNLERTNGHLWKPHFPRRGFRWAHS